MKRENLYLIGAALLASTALTSSAQASSVTVARPVGCIMLPDVTSKGLVKVAMGICTIPDNTPKSPTPILFAELLDEMAVTQNYSRDRLVQTPPPLHDG